MAFTESQQAILNRVRGRLSNQPGQDDEDERKTSAQRQWEILDEVRSRIEPQQPVASSVEEPGMVRGASDVAVGALTGVPKAVGALVGLGSLVPGVNYIADPISQGLYDLGEMGDEALLSDYQLQKNQELGARIAEAAATVEALPEDSTISERVDHIYNTIVAQGGEAGAYLSENPGQIVNFIAQTAPHILLGGAAGKAVKGGAAVAGVGMTGRTAGAIGEGLIAGGDATANIVRDSYEGVGTAYSPNRLAGAAAGIGTSLVSRGLASKFDVDTLAAGGVADLMEGATRGGLLKAGTVSAAREGAEEFLQSGQEQAFTNVGQGKPFYEGVGSSAVIGAATGAGLGAGTGVLGQRSVNKQQNQLDAQAADQAAKEEAILIQQEQEQAEREGLQRQAELEQQARTRREAAQTFTPRKEFVAAREKEIKAQLEKDVLNPSTEMGAAFEKTLNDNAVFDPADVQAEAKKFVTAYQKERKADTDKQLTDEYITALDNHTVKFDQAKQLVEQNPTLMEMDQVEMDLMAPTNTNPAGRLAEYNIPDAETYSVIRKMRENTAKARQAQEKIDLTQASTEAVATNEVQEAPAKKPTKKEQLRTLATEKLGETFEQDHPELSQLLADGKGIYSRGKGKKSRFETMLDKIVAEQATTEAAPEAAPVAQPEANLQETEAAPAAPEETAATTPVVEQAPVEPTPTEPTPTEQTDDSSSADALTGIEAQAVDYATEKLGENWRTEQPQLVQLLKDKQYAGLQSNVDRLAEEKKQVATQTNAVIEAFSRPLPKEVKLSPNEEKVFNTLQQAFQNNEQDEYIQANGSLNPERIAQAAGLNSRQAAQTAITRLRPKIAKTYGVTQEQIKQRLAETKAKTVEAFDANAADQAVEMSELGQSMGTVASANQGARDGMAQEDRDFLDNMEETPNRVQSQEERDAIRAELDKEIKADPAYKGARDTWNNGFETDVESEADRISFDGMDAGSRFEFMSRYVDFQRGEYGVDELGTYYDDIRAAYLEDTQNATTKIADESGPTESAAIEETPRPDGGEVRQEGDDTAGDRPAETKFYVAGQEVSPSTKKPVITVKKSSKLKGKRFSRGQTNNQEPVEAVVSALEFTADALFGIRTMTDERQKEVGVMRANSANSAIQIHKSPKDAVRQLGGSMTLQELQDAKAFIDPRNGEVAHFIASNISSKEAEGVLLHEVGVHLGIEAQMEPEQIASLADVVRDWENAEEGSIERDVFEKATGRVAFARATGMDASLADIEFIAYAVEEAANAGVSLDPDVSAKDATAKVRQWLSDIRGFFQMLMQRWVNRGKVQAEVGERFEVLGAEELVALARGAGYVAYDAGVVERGAFTDDEQELAEFYGATDRGRRVEDDAVVEVDPDFAGQEIFAWGTNSEFGPYKNISTDAAFNRYPDGEGSESISLNMAVYSEEVDNGMTPITSLSLGEIAPNVYSLTVYGPMNQDGNVSDIKDVDGDEWTRLEGVTHSQNMRILTEARRRITRFTGGLVPNIMFSRVTGAAAANTDDARGGEMLSDDIRKRFSKNMPPEKKARETRAWVRDTLGETATQFYDDAAFIARNAVDSTKFLHQFIRENIETMPSAKRWYDGMLEADKTRNDIRRSVEDVAIQARNLAPERLEAVNDFIGKSTFFQKWGYDPEIEGREVKIDPVMQAAFLRLTEDERELVKKVFAHGEKMRVRKQEIAKKLGVDGKFFSDAAIEGPYAPLKRFGNFAGELKSQELLDAEAALREDRTTANQKRVDDLKSAENHYMISFFDTMGAAKQFADANAANFPFAEASERAPDMESERITNPEVFEQILGQLRADQNSGIDSNAKKAFADMVKKMYFQSLDERSARQSGARRMNRAGYEKNMIRAFLAHSRAEASMIANMEHGAEINTALVEAANEARTDRENLQGVYNMIAKHYRDTLVGKETPIQDRLAAMNSVYMLTTSIGYHVTNATQPAMVTIPKLAGDFRNYSGAWGALIRGYKISTAATTMDSNIQVNIDIDKAPPKYRKLLQELELRQLLDVGMEEDLSEFDRFNTGYEPLNRLSDSMGKIVHKLYQVARYVEAHNRISSAIAAYDMATANPSVPRKMNMTPEEYATSIVEDTQGNFARFDAPYLIKALPKLTTQYRKYQLMMAWNYASAFKKSTPYLNKEFSPEEVATARRTLGYLLGHAGLFAGATGIPLATTIAPYFLAMASGDDEPQDLERWIRANVEDERLADVLSRGVFSFAGIDMSTKLSQSKIFHPFPYVDFEASEDGVKDVFFNAFAGPAGTTALNFGRAASYLEQGDLMKATEYAVPKGIRTLIESYRLGTEGYSMKNGDVLVDPREIDVKSLLLNAIGIPATDINKIKWTRGQQFELEQYFSKESGRIRRQYVEAKESRDTKRLAELREEWRDLQQQKDRVRPFFNNARNALRRQPMSDLFKAPRRQDRRERRASERFR